MTCVIVVKTVNSIESQPVQVLMIGSTQLVAINELQSNNYSVTGWSIDYSIILLISGWFQESDNVKKIKC